MMCLPDRGSLLDPALEPFSARRLDVPPRSEGRLPTVAVTVEGRTIVVPAGASAAAAVLAAGFDSIREDTGGGFGARALLHDGRLLRLPRRDRRRCRTARAAWSEFSPRCGSAARPGRGGSILQPDDSRARYHRRGPAGIAAAVLAAELRLDTVLVDEQESPGGQIYRAIERAEPDTPLGSDYLAGRPLAAALRASRVDYRPGTNLWHIDPDGTLFLENAGRTETVIARRVLLATGAIERPVPIPGWTLPGVHDGRGGADPVEVGGSRPGRRRGARRTGTAPLLVASQLVRAGAPPVRPPGDRAAR